MPQKGFNKYHLTYQAKHVEVLVFRKRVGHKVKISYETCKRLQELNRSLYVRDDGYVLIAKKLRKDKNIYLHRFVMGAKKGDYIDHINQDKLDNRIENLRFCNGTENQLNKKKAKGDYTSKYKGTSYCRSKKKWRACGYENNKFKHIGLYDTELEAAKAYDRHIKTISSDFSYTNFDKGRYIVTFNEYQKLAKRTAPKGRKNSKLANLALGVCGEAGELGEIFKKYLYHDHELNVEEVKKEAGDVMWYVANILDACGLSFDEVAEMNIEKLKKRYPSGFSADKSINREE